MRALTWPIPVTLNIDSAVVMDLVFALIPQYHIVSSSFDKHERPFKQRTPSTSGRTPERETEKQIQAEGGQPLHHPHFTARQKLRNALGNLPSFPYPAGDISLTWQKQRTGMCQAHGSALFVWNTVLLGLWCVWHCRRNEVEECQLRRR
jgi:hypothetical protein